ncbi:hypothetical protein BCR39DRAFT_550921 [Naematelia encephala]|uniref:Uncharacterized protein n=1 Tax=Naematelia encephala TaxID=71784 RepID=A0A1Y2AKE3_9TREE|nr:hypothetical protein BCR39DRAFT_550921 [Naematelia encephala]
MPVTKKKGAIFAIYADSPTHSSTTTHGPPKSVIPSTSTSPTKRTCTSKSTRKALSALQPSTTKGFPVSSIKSDVSTLKPTSTSTNPKPSTLATKLAAHPTKRQLEIFSSPSIPTKPPMQHTGGSPAKRTRQTPRVDKENNPPPIEGSPASRTRSKTSSIGSMAQLQFAKLASSSPRPKKQSGLLGKSATTIQREDSDTFLSGVHLQLADGQPSGLTPRATRSVSESMNGPRSTSKRTPGGEVKRKGGKGLGVRADGPLVDVSEAYGASGEEPVGFRDQ